jgi:hypothetical protein
VRRFERWLFLLIFLLGAWVTLHSYQGLHHDARLYALEALSRLESEKFVGDLHLDFNPQGGFTIFSPLFELSIQLWGLEAASLVLFFLGQGLWLAGLSFLIIRLFGGNLLPLLFLFVATLPAGYGGFDALAFGEGFVTPRLFSEAVILFGTAFLFSGAWVIGLALYLLSVALHPLMGAGALGIFIILLTIERPRWGIAIIAVAMSAILVGVLTEAPLVGELAERAELNYLDLLRDRTPYLFLTLWRAPDLANLLLVFALLAFAVKTNVGTQKRFFLTVLLASLSATILSLVGGDVFHSILVTKVQPWRLLWLGQVVGVLGLAKQVALRSSQPNVDGKSEQTLLLLVVIAVAASGFAPLASLVALWGLGCLLLHPRLCNTRILSAALSPLTALLLLAALIMGIMDEVERSEGAAYDLFHTLLPLSMLAAYILVERANGKARVVGLCLCTSLAFLSFSAWNQQSDASAYLIHRPDLIAKNGTSLPLGENVYWPGNPMAVWFGLERGSYYSYEQGAGVAFSKKLAEEFQRRRAIVAPLGGSFTRSFAEFGNTSPLEVNLPELLIACGKEGSFDAIVLPAPLPGVGGQVLVAPRVISGNVPTVEGRYYLYRCAELPGA